MQRTSANADTALPVTLCWDPDWVRPALELVELSLFHWLVSCKILQSKRFAPRCLVSALLCPSSFGRMDYIRWTESILIEREPTAVPLAREALYPGQMTHNKLQKHPNQGTIWAEITTRTHAENNQLFRRLNRSVVFLPGQEPVSDVGTTANMTSFLDHDFDGGSDFLNDTVERPGLYGMRWVKCENAHRVG